MLLLFEFSAACFLLLMLGVMGERWYRIFSQNSARFVTVNASTNLYWKIRKMVGRGVEIIMPVGQGLYPASLWWWQRQRWERRLERWVRKGVTVTLLITSPNPEAIKYWQERISQLKTGLTVFSLDRKLATEKDAIEIAKLDRFHPVLIFKGDERLGMWIESDHPPRSKVAYNVEYVSRKDIVDFQQARFDRYLRVLRSLTDETRRPLYLTKISPSALRPDAQSVVAA